MEIEIRRVPTSGFEVRFEDVPCGEFFVASAAGTIYCKIDGRHALRLCGPTRYKVVIEPRLPVEVLNAKKMVLEVEEK